MDSKESNSGNHESKAKKPKGKRKERPVEEERPEEDAVAEVFGGFDGNIPIFENLSSPWKTRRRFDPTQLQPLLSLLEKCSQEYIQANLGTIMSELSALMPSIGKCFVSTEMTSPEAFREFSILFCTLIKQKGRLPRVLALSALEEVLASGNILNTKFLEPQENSEMSVFSILVMLLLASDDVDILNGALQCILRMLCATSTWDITTGEIFRGGDNSPFERLKNTMCSKGCRIPLIMMEGYRIFLIFATFSNGAKRIREIYPILHTDERLMKTFFDCLDLMERGFRRLKAALTAFKKKTFLREYHLFVVLEHSPIVPSLNILLEIKLKCPSLLPLNSYNFLSRILASAHGLLFLTRVPEMAWVVQSLRLLAEKEAKEEVDKKKSNFDPSAPTAQSLLNRIAAGWTVLAFCDKLKAMRGDVEKTVSEEGVVEFLAVLQDQVVRQEFSVIVGEGFFYMLLDEVVSLKDKQSANCKSKLQFFLFLINASLEKENEQEFWLENNRRLYKSIKGNREFRDIPGFNESPLGCLMRDGVVDTTDISKLAGTFARNIARLLSKGITKDQIYRIHLAEFLCMVEQGRNIVLHALLENDFVAIVEEKLRELLKIALPRFQAGMANCAEEQALLFKFALPVMRILDYCTNIDQELSVLTPTLIEAILGLLTISSDMNGQTSSNPLASDVRIAMIKLLQGNLFLKTNKSLLVLTVLVGKGSETPLFYGELLDLFQMMLPAQLPIPIVKADLKMTAKIDEEHDTAMQLWMANIPTLVDTRLAQALLCSDPFVHEKSVRLIRQIVTYGHSNITDVFAWIILDYVGKALGGNKYLPKEIGIEEVSDGEKEKEEAGSKLRASAADARLMVTVCRLICTGMFAKSMANTLPQCDYTMKAMFGLFCRPWNHSTRQDLFQEAVLEIIEVVLLSDNKWKIQKNGETDRKDTVVPRLLKILVMFLVDRLQNPVLVSKAAQILKGVLDKDPRKKHQLVHNFTDGLFVPLLRRIVEEPTAEIKATVITICQILVSITPLDSGILYYALFSSIEPRVQAMQALLELVECDPKEPFFDMEVISKLYALAAVGANKEANFSLFAGEESVAADPPAVKKFRLVDTDIETRKEQPAQVGKSTRSREVRIGSKMAKVVNRNADQQACEAVSGLVKSMEGINKKKVTPPPGLKFE